MLLKSRLAHAEDTLAGFPGQKKPGSAEMALSAAMDITSETPAIIEFGHFRVVPRRRELLADGRPIYLGGRSFDVLMALIEASGAVVGKDALMDRVWPNRVEVWLVLSRPNVCCLLRVGAQTDVILWLRKAQYWSGRTKGCY
jgi:hypothetical protein